MDEWDDDDLKNDGRLPYNTKKKSNSINTFSDSNGNKPFSYHYNIDWSNGITILTIIASMEKCLLKKLPFSHWQLLFSKTKLFS